MIRPEELRIRVGEWDVNNDSEFYPNIEFDVLYIKTNPQYTPGNLYNDIAIIKLDGIIDFQRNPHISPICLPDSFQVDYLLDIKNHILYLQGAPDLFRFLGLRAEFKQICDLQS